jgi:hypothetical protein
MSGNLPAVTIRRLAVFDATSFALVFDHVWSWQGERSAEALSTLVRSFLQFASEVDAGEVSKVKFSASAAAEGGAPPGHHRTRSRTGPVLNGQRRATAGAQQEMYLQCLRSGRCLVAAFLQYTPSESVDREVSRFLSTVALAHSGSASDAEHLREALLDCVDKAFGRAVAEDDVAVM